jgi:hypothetical protein
VTHKRPTPFDDAAYDEGREAEWRGASFQTCPYFFGDLGVTQEEFERDYRAKMNGWTYGWIDSRDARAEAAKEVP